jgi:membrane protease YdiL (CAAX protease family)
MSRRRWSLKPTSPVHRWMVRHPVATFLIWFFTVGQALAFAPVVAERAYGTALPTEPFVVASTLIGLLLPTFAITWIVDGPDGVRLLWRRIRTVRVPLGWYAFAIVGVPLATLAATFALYGLPAQVSASAVGAAVVHGLFLQAFVVLVTNNLWEEVAWMGFVQSRLQDRHGPLRAALLTAPLFALQHVSLVVDNSPVAAVIVMTAMTLFAVPFRALVGAAYNATGSLLIVGLIHAMGNGMTGGSNIAEGFLPRLYNGELIGVMHQLASAVIGVVMIVATRGSLRHQPTQRSADQPPVTTTTLRPGVRR